MYSDYKGRLPNVCVYRMQAPMKSVKAFELRGDLWVCTRGDASSVLSPAGLLLEYKQARQRVDFVPATPMALSSFSVEGPVDVVMKFFCKEDGLEVLLRKKSGDLKHYPTKWDMITMEVPILKDETNRFSVSFQMNDSINMVSFSELFESQEEMLVLKCAGDEEVHMNFLAAAASSKLVRKKFEMSEFRNENHSLDLLKYDAATVEAVKTIMTSRTVSIAHVNHDCIALMDYLEVEDLQSVWKLARSFLNKDNCLDFMRLADRYKDAETIRAGLKFSVDSDMDEQAEAASIMEANISLFKVADARALCDAFEAK